MKILSKLVNLIQKNKKFLIASHINPEGDSVGSSIALALGLKKLRKSVSVVNRDAVPEVLRFLPFSNLFSRSRKIRTQKFDVLFIIDCNTIERAGFKMNHLKAKNIVIIDHHIHSVSVSDQCQSRSLNTDTICWIDPSASATGELIYKLLDALRVPIDKGIATNLYTAILTDTGGFRYSNTTPESLNIASQLVKAGADPWEITREVYENFSFNCLRLLTLCLMTLKKEDKLAWLTITKDMYKKTNTSVEDIEDFVDYPRKIRGIEVAILFRQDGRNLYKISLRSKGSVNVANIARAFGGGGHANAAGCEMKGSLEEVKRRVFKAVRNSIKNAKCKMQN